MKYNNTTEENHLFFTSLDYKEQQYGYTRKNKNGTMQIITPFPNCKYQIWGVYTNEDDGMKIYNTGIIEIPYTTDLKSIVNVFEQIKEQ